MQPAGKSEGHGKRIIRVAEGIAEGVVVDALEDVARTVSYSTQRAHLIIGKIVVHPRHGHGHRHPAIGVLEALDQIIRSVIDRQQLCAALPKVLFDDSAVDPLGDPSAERVMLIGDGPTVR